MHLAIVLFTITVLVSCDKNDSPPKSNTDYIIQGSWKFEKATSSGTDVSGFLPTCHKDNIMTFLANGSGTFDEGPTKCNSGDPQTTNFTWNFTNNGGTLNVNAPIFAGQSGAFKVVTLNDTQMVLEGTITTSSGTVTGQIYFKH